MRQNVLARRIGLRMITFFVTLFLAAFAIQIVYAGATYLANSGVLRPRSLTADPEP